MTAASSDVNSKIKRDRPETNGQLQEIAVKAEMVRFNFMELCVFTRHHNCVFFRRKKHTKVVHR